MKDKGKTTKQQLTGESRNEKEYTNSKRSYSRRIEFWVGQGAQLSDRVASLLKQAAKAPEAIEAAPEATA